MTAGSPFLDAPTSQWLCSNRSAFAIADPEPVSIGHSLVVPRRLIRSWWECTPDERLDLWDLVDEVKQRLDESLAPDGYNVGFDSGRSAGQFVDHLHLHVIPRYGDTERPSTGIRNVATTVGTVAAAGSASPIGQAHLVDSVDDRTLKLELLRCFMNEDLDQLELLVSFIQPSGLRLVDAHLAAALSRGAVVRLLTTDYMSITHPDALARLLDLSRDPVPEDHGTLELRVFADPRTSFHPKAYLFSSSATGRGQGFVGSNNLSRSGIEDGIEWALRTDDVTPLRSGFEQLWEDVRSVELNDAWLADYRTRWIKQAPVDAESGAAGAPPETYEPIVDVEWEPPAEPAIARPIQVEALRALDETREAGHRAGLVVLATGLGKTWLAAFDAEQGEADRVLFIAHRTEILTQARNVFRQVRPDARLGFFGGSEKDSDADVVFASVQTLHRHLDDFEPAAFDYVVVDEFHHASASSYRRVIDHFDPSFLLGLTATPERMDGADLLALCGDNLVFECDLVEGVTRDELAPFQYWGVADTVDFAPIPWRNGQFDPAALEVAVATRDRADAAHAEWAKRAGQRTLGFCVSIRHAEYMAEYFRELGIPAVALHSRSEADLRVRAVEELERGDLRLLFTVDLFNEGVDLPLVDTVLMLRPTQSPVVFLQQLGRGLRTALGKSHLAVVDFVGNHRSFLAPLRTLLSLSLGRPPTNDELREAVASGNVTLPAGCSVEYSLEAIDLLGSLVREQRSSVTDVLRDLCLQLADEEGTRPSALQVSIAGGNVRASTQRAGGWFELLNTLELLSEQERAVLAEYAGFLHDVATTAMTKSFKMLLLRALLHDGRLRTGASLSDLATRSLRIVQGDPRLTADVDTQEIPSVQIVDSDRWSQYWRTNPVEAWANSAWFDVVGDSFESRLHVAPQLGEAFDAMVAELVEWRLHNYLVRGADSNVGDAVLSLFHSSGSPIIRLDRSRFPHLPEGPTEFLADGERYTGRFVKMALNTASTSRNDGNALPALLRRWFGPSAGHPGSDHRVVLSQSPGGWQLRPETAVNVGAAPDSLPHFPTYPVACGAFDLPVPADAAPRRQPISDIGELNDDFLVTVRGETMSGGPNPVRHGDLVRMRWVRNRSVDELVGHEVLVELTDGGVQRPVLKKLVRDQSGLMLRSTADGFDDIPGSSSMRVVGELVERVDPRSWNPLGRFLGQAYKRNVVPPLFGLVYNPGNWQTGHVTLPDDTILFVTLDKLAGRDGEDYVDRFESPDIFHWTSQNSTSPEGKKGVEINDALETGRRIHLFVRRKKNEVAFTYCGLVAPIRHEGSRPMTVWFRLLTPLSGNERRRFIDR